MRAAALIGLAVWPQGCRAREAPGRVAAGPLLPEDRMTTWEPGVRGGVPRRTIVCDDVSAARFEDGRVDASAGIQKAIDACAPGQVVHLSSGAFLINDGVLLVRKGVTLRGEGPGRTVLMRTNGAKPGSDQAQVADPVVVLGPARGARPDDATSRPLAIDAAKGARSVTLTDAAAFARGEVVLVDEDHYTTAAWRSLPPRYGLPTNVKVWASDRVVWRRHDPPEPGDDPLPRAAAWFSRAGRPIAEVKEVASVVGNVVSFTTPLHIGYRTSHAAQLTRYPAGHVREAGLEDLTVTGGGHGNVRFECAAASWMRHVESTAWLGEGVSVDNSFRVEVRDSYVHDAAWLQPGGGGYAISLSGGAAEVLIENNIVRQANKMMVARSAGAGSVVGYNSMDDGLIASDRDWVETGIGGSHMAGSHHILFEGNQSFNYDSDNTHGSAILHTVFRNHLTGLRRSFEGLRNARACGLMSGSRWHSFVGNVLGTEGRMDGWTYEGGLPWTVPAVWKLGYDPGHWEQSADPLVTSSVLREGNFDYLTRQVHWDTQPRELPPSLYLRTKPAFFGSRPWPWVDATGPRKLETLPARVRLDAGTPLAPTP
jgi:hypothetical protein